MKRRSGRETQSRWATADYAHQMGKKVLMVISCVIAFASAVTPASAVPVDLIGAAELKGVAPYDRAGAFSGVLILPERARVGFEDIHGVPRRGRKAIVVVWLVSSRGRAYIGGGFPTSSNTFLDTIVPGSRGVAHRNARAARSIVLTIMPTERAFRVYKRAKDQGFSRAAQIVGRPIMKGLVQPR